MEVLSHTIRKRWTIELMNQQFCVVHDELLIHVCLHECNKINQVTKLKRRIFDISNEPKVQMSSKT